LSAPTITAEVMDTVDGIPAEVARQLAMLDGPTPKLAIGVHCDPSSLALLWAS
jgi:hypothetical protein